MSYNLKSIRQEFRDKGIFYTTTELAEYLKNLAGFEPLEVYDPTCGDGSLLSVFGDDVKKYGQEINDHQLNAAKDRLINFTGVCGDTLKAPAFFGKKFDCIVANPPFSIDWEPPQLGGLFNDERFSNIPAMPPKSKADYAFILHILNYLSDKGVAVVLSFPGVLYRGGAEGKLRQWIIEQNLIDKVVRIEGKKFVDTTIETAVLIFRKNKETTDIEFVDAEKGISKVVGIDEIKNNDYQLSVSRYIFEEKISKKIDALETNNLARKQMIERLKSDIAFDAMVCQIEGWEHVGYLQQILDAVNYCIDIHATNIVENNACTVL